MKYLIAGKKIIVSMLIAASLAFIPQHAAAETTATFSGGVSKEKTIPNVPFAYEYIGIVRNIDLAKRTITIDGNKHYYGIDIKVQTQSSDFVPVTTLTKETLVGFNFISDDANRRILQNILILSGIPASLSPLEH